MHSWIVPGFLLLTGMVVSCNDDKMTTVIPLTVSQGQTLVEDLHICGDEEGAVIEIQATHFERSELVRDSSTFFCVGFFYKPIAGYSGIDFVRIKTNTGSNGASKGNTGYVEYQITVL